jgi:cytochrome c-type biogenesis protein CcmF
MAQVGQFTLALAFVVTLYSIAASLAGIRLRNDKLIASGRNAAVAVFGLITAAIGSLAYLFVVDDFSVSYIAGHSNRDLPLYFKISSIWGGQEGSLLFWGWLLTIYAALVVIQNRRKHSSMMPYVTAVLMGTSAFFTAMHLFVVNPFKIGAVQFPDGTLNLFTPRDGMGLNPLLQDWLMVIHPPMLYLGFVGFVVPFSFAIAALVTRQLGDTWIRTTRRWTMVAWLFLGSGILLGGNWAYHELGWGGFWAWDPVENASLMPWLIGTAYLHSVMVQEKKGMLKVWNVVLVVLAYIMAIFGTFLTRSGIVSSVHAFAQSSIGGYFLAFIVVGLSGALYLVFDRLEYLKSDNQMESFVSRESSFMFNNLLLLAACFAVLWGTMLPSLSDWVTGEKITVNAPWFNKVNVPIAIFLLFLTGVGPLLAWRKASTNSLKRNFLEPLIIALCGGVILYVRGIHHFYALTSLMMVIFVGCTILREFYRGARARALGTGERIHQALINLTLRNTRRYGGYIIHFGFVLLFIGWTGQAFTTEAQFEAGIGDTYQLRQYTFRIDDLGNVDGQNYAAQRATVGVYEGGKKVAVFHPERRVYEGAEGQQPTTEVALWERAKEDLYLVFAGASADGKRAVFQVFLNPLVLWVWIGGWILVFGTLVALLPNKKSAPTRRAKPSSQVKEDAGVEQTA